MGWKEGCGDWSYDEDDDEDVFEEEDDFWPVSVPQRDMAMF